MCSRMGEVKRGSIFNDQNILRANHDKVIIYQRHSLKKLMMRPLLFQPRAVLFIVIQTLYIYIQLSRLYIYIQIQLSRLYIYIVIQTLYLYKVIKTLYVQSSRLYIHIKSSRLYIHICSYQHHIYICLSRPYIHIFIQTKNSFHPDHIYIQSSKPYIHVFIQTIYSCIQPNHVYIYSHPRLDRYTSSTMSIKLNTSSQNSLSLVHKP